ncbi:MAG: hypothetical protein JXQ90_12245 [Cyclobacteriaceae bacterium]
MKRLILLCLTGLVLACEVPDNSNLQSDLPDVKQSVMELTAELVKGNAELKKRANFDGKEEFWQYKPSQEEWEKELEIFHQLNLNKPRYIGAMDIELSDGMQVYTPRPGENIDIVYVSISEDKTQVISGEVKNDNAAIIYTTYNRLKLVSSESKLLEYEISGFQKIIMSDTSWYQVHGAILWED